MQESPGLPCRKLPIQRVLARADPPRQKHVGPPLGFPAPGPTLAEFFQGDHAVLHHQIYTLALMLLFFPVAAVLFWRKKDLIEHRGSNVDDGSSDEPRAEQPSKDQNEPSLNFQEILCKLLLLRHTHASSFCLVRRAHTYTYAAYDSFSFLSFKAFLRANIVLKKAFL